MPELPEVETIVNDLKPVMKGLVFREILISNRNSVVGGAEGFDAVKGRKIVEVFRRGKFINMRFDNDYILTIHLRMSGRLILEKIAEHLKHERARLVFDKAIIYFCDTRKFGRIWLNKKTEFEKNTGIAKLGIEPLSKEFTLKKFLELVSGRKGILKNFLLDQSVIAGIGNIYADESCFHAKVRPNRRLESLNKKELEKLFSGIKKALQQGVKNRGTSISDFIDAKGKKGTNQELLYVYGRKDEKCLICGQNLTKIKAAGRTTIFCKKCQK